MLRNVESDNLVQDAEIRMAAFVTEHNLSFNIMDHLSELLPKVFPDSEIAQQFKSKCTKTSKVIKNACAPYFHELLQEKLKVSRFSLIIDETTDISTAKELSIVCRFFSKVDRQVVSHFYELVSVSSGDAASLYQCIIFQFESDGIPLSNIIGCHVWGT